MATGCYHIWINMLLGGSSSVNWFQVASESKDKEIWIPTPCTPPTVESDACFLASVRLRCAISVSTVFCLTRRITVGFSRTRSGVRCSAWLGDNRSRRKDIACCLQATQVRTMGGSKIVLTGCFTGKEQPSSKRSCQISTHCGC